MAQLSTKGRAQRGTPIRGQSLKVAHQETQSKQWSSLKLHSKKGSITARHTIVAEVVVTYRKWFRNTKGSTGHSNP
eukprot:4193665-Pleurochrysis_carterae.AAC.1